MEDCLRSLKSIEHLNNEHVNNVINLIRQWLSDPKSVTEEGFRSAAAAAARAAARAARAVAWAASNAAAWAASNAAAWAARAAGDSAAARAAAYAAFAINPNVNRNNIKTIKLQEYMRVARILLSQHTKNKPTINKDNKRILISTIQNEDKHGIIRLLQDYLFPEFEKQMKEFEEYLKELYEIKGELSLDELVSLIIANKNEFILFINKFIL